MQGLVQAGGVIASVFHARLALFEVLQRLHGGRPTEALLLGCLLLGVALGCAPIALLQYGQAQGARRALVLTAALGTLLVMLRPPLPTKVPLCLAGPCDHLLAERLQFVGLMLERCRWGQRLLLRTTSRGIRLL